MRSNLSIHEKNSRNIKVDIVDTMADYEKEFRDVSVEDISSIFVHENNTLNKKIKKEKRDAIENRKKYFAAKKFMNTNHMHDQEK